MSSNGERLSGNVFQNLNSRSAVRKQINQADQHFNIYYTGDHKKKKKIKPVSADLFLA